MRRGCRIIASAVAAALLLGLSTPSVAMANTSGKTHGSYKSYQYVNNREKANQKVEASKEKIYGIIGSITNSAGAASEATTSYIDMLIENGMDVEEADVLAAFKDITFGGKTIIGETETDPKKIKPFFVTIGRLKVTLNDKYKLKKIEIGVLEPDKEGKTGDMVYSTIRSGEQLTLSEVLPSDESLPYAPTEIRISFYSTERKTNGEYTVILYRQIEEE